MKNKFLFFCYFISAYAGFSQSPVQTVYVDYSTANFDDLFYPWTFNSNYIAADTTGGKSPFNYAAVAITNPLAGYTNPGNISGTIGEWNYSTSSPLIIDSIFAVVTHENNSGQFDKIIMEIVLLDNTDKPTSTVLWSKTDSTNVTLSPGMNWTGPNSKFVLRYNPNYTILSNQKVGLNLKYIGSKLDTFSIVAGSIDNGSGGTNQQSNYKNSWTRIPPFIPNLFKNANIGYGYPAGSDGWFEGQNWRIWARLNYYVLPTITSFSPSSVCSGSTITISGTNFTGATSVTIGGIPVNSFTVNSTTSITATVGSGTTGLVSVVTPTGTATSSGILTITPQPSTPAIASSGSLSICQGQSVTLTSSSASNYNWSNGQQTQSITVSPSQTTSYTVTVGSGNCTATSQAVTVVVNSLVPTPTITPSGSLTICQGQSVTLTSSGASNYNWSNGQQTQSITVSPSQTTSYTVTVGSDNCTATSQVLTVVVGTAPVVTNQPQNQLSSLGQTARFVATTSTPSASYQWQSDVGLGFQNLSNAGQYSGVINDTLLVSSITPNNNNQSFRCIVSNGGCADTTNAAILSVCALIITGQPQSQTVDLATNATFSVSGGNIQTYQWQSDLGFGFQSLSNAGQYSGVDTNTLTVSNVTTANNGQAFRCAVSLDGCSDTTVIALLTVNNNVGISEASIPAFSIYPNPAKSQINIQAKTKLLGSAYTIYDKTGKTILMGKIISENMIIELGNLSAGIYFLSMGDYFNQSFKIIKE